MGKIERLRTAGELLARGHPWVRSEVPADTTGIRAWATDGAYAFLSSRADGGPGWLNALGEPSAAIALVRHALAELPVKPRGFTVPRSAHILLPADLPVRDIDHWNFRWTSTPPPPMPGEERVVELKDADEEIRELLSVASPRHSAPPGDPTVRRWVGIRDEHDRLVACGAETRRPGGLAHLASIATLPGMRGRGLGAAVTAWLTRRVLDEGDDVCTLGQYADNEVARRLYSRLGYTDDDHFTSGRFG
ncbi:GNAT family N-acetyltransferase [Carbonactinospora thermoautotrophica]|uniref:GNAT family N-acetyltransferase n=1 Tax=Carbonactinospora thermoautotrophica TaxID=1469144 RepID=UPI0022707C65|nr:GNAT family N-acetyltransferase [Carbonactinospora thermoautotrophica]